MTENEFSAITVADTRITARRSVRTAAERVLGRLWIDRLPTRLADGDPLLWGLPADAADCRPARPAPALDLLPQITELAGRLRAAEITEVILVGSGPTARAAEVIARSSGGVLTVLEGLDPGPALRLGADHERLRRSAVVVTGDGPVADALLRTLRGMFEKAGMSADEIAQRSVVVAEPDGPATEQAYEAGRPLIHAGPHPVFGALSPAALVPAALAGADVAAMLDQAADLVQVLGRPERNPGLVLGAILGGCARSGRRTVVIGQYPCPIPGLGDWIGRLLSGATEGRVLPVVQHGGLPLMPADDLFLVSLGGRPHQDEVTVSGPLAVQLMIWEYAAAVAAHLLGADPFARSGGAIAEAALDSVNSLLQAPVRAPGAAAETAAEPTARPTSADPAAAVPDATAPRFEEAAVFGPPVPQPQPELRPEPEPEPAAGPGPGIGGHLGAGTDVGAYAGGYSLGGPEPGMPAERGLPEPNADAAAGSVPGTAVQVPEGEAVTGFETPAEVLDRLIAILPSDGHLTVLASLDPDETAGQATKLRRLAGMLAARCGRPVTVECGFVNHSREKGVYLVLTGNVTRDAPVPDGGRTLASLQLTQALAIVRALRERGRPVARLHLADRHTGMDQLLEVAQGGA